MARSEMIIDVRTCPSLMVYATVMITGGGGEGGKGGGEGPWGNCGGYGGGNRLAIFQI
jgi:hypothetical protein